MKIFLLFILCFSSGYGYAQNRIESKPIDTIPVFHVDNERQLCYEDIVSMGETKKEILYNAAKKWYVTTFNNSNYAIRSDDKEAGIIVAKGFYNKVVAKPNSGAISFGRQADYNFTVTIECRDNRYKYKINDIYVNGKPAETYINAVTHKKNMKPLDYAAMNDLHATFLNLGESIKSQINKAVQTDNW